jgi:hypothetical protein
LSTKYDTTQNLFNTFNIYHVLFYLVLSYTILSSIYILQIKQILNVDIMFVKISFELKYIIKVHYVFQYKYILKIWKYSTVKDHDLWFSIIWYISRINKNMLKQSQLSISNQTVTICYSVLLYQWEIQIRIS